MYPSFFLKNLRHHAKPSMLEHERGGREKEHDLQCRWASLVPAMFRLMPAPDEAVDITVEQLLCVGVRHRDHLREVDQRHLIVIVHLSHRRNYKSVVLIWRALLNSPSSSRK